MSSYPKATPKVLNPSGNVKMKAQMSHASKPHGTFQESAAKGTRGVVAFSGNDASGVRGKVGGNPMTMSKGGTQESAAGERTEKKAGMDSVAEERKEVGNMAKAGRK